MKCIGDFSFGAVVAPSPQIACHEGRGPFSSLFRHGARGTSRVEIDGRLITGMNWESTRGVVAAIIRMLEAEGGAALISPTGKL